MKTWGMGLAVALVALAGCSHGQSQTRTTPANVGQPAAQADGHSDPISRELDRVMAEADGNQPGKVREVGHGELVLDPYQQAAGDSRLRLEREVPVFQGQGRVTSDALQPGTDVRVFYKHSPAGNAAPEVVGVEILDPTQAREINDAIRDAPKNNDDTDDYDEDMNRSESDE